ncbi:MAG: type II toxin-antitoxin system HicB family antitoxin [Candidatus Poribacteria bacterium]|nr:type II toxin-antitoxin system HicB family antitoxin [Candidatus Poribacteria bacterium]
MKTYTFEVVIEEDEWLDERIKDPVWRAYIPTLVHQGASSWGYTKKEALKNLQDAVDLLIESLLEHGEEHLLQSIVQHEKVSTSEPCSHIQVSDVPLIVITV